MTAPTVVSPEPLAKQMAEQAMPVRLVMPAGTGWPARRSQQRAGPVHDQLEAAPRHELLQKGLLALIGFRLSERTMRIEFSVLHPVPFLDPAGKMIEGLKDRALSFLQPPANKAPPNHLPSEQTNYQLLSQGVFLISSSHVNTPKTPQDLAQIVNGPMAPGVHIFRIHSEKP